VQGFFFLDFHSPALFTFVVIAETDSVCFSKNKTMYYFIVTFTATINGDLTEAGTAGVISKIKDHRANAIKTTAIEFYQKKYNTSKPVTVSISGTVLPYSQDLYELLRPKLTIEIIEK
jgi:hypothetical protein